MERAELIRLARETGCAEEHNGFVFLCDPRWGAAERARFAELRGAVSTGAPKPEAASTAGLAAAADSAELRTPNSDRRADPHLPSSAPPLPRAPAGAGWLCIATGGSSGGLKFARHDELTLGAAVSGFCAHFGFRRVNAVDVLPPHHVSGFMARVRCAATGGTHLAWDWKRLEAGERPPLRGDGWGISLVPTQLQRLLGSPEAIAWLRDFAVIFIGGGPTWPALADDAARAGLRLSLSYGMTESAAMVAALRPEEFLAGARSSGAPMPHARIAVAEDGAVSITGESVFRGYFPETRASRCFETSDLGRFDAAGHLHLLGRSDAAIITGGEKVQPLEVEAALRASGEFADVAVIGLPDAEWGERVVACYPAADREPDWSRVEEAVASLPAFKRPKRFIALARAEWPRNALGKLNRDRVRRVAGSSQLTAGS